MNINEYEALVTFTHQQIWKSVQFLLKSCLPRIPVCVRMCPRSSHGLEKALPQVVHTQGSVCERMCIFRAPRLVYSLGQCLQ